MAMANGSHVPIPNMQLKGRNSTRKKVTKSNTFNAAASSSLPTSPVSPRKRPTKQLPPEPRLTKAVYLLMEAKKLARELESKKVAGNLFRPFSAKTSSTQSSRGHAASDGPPRPGSAFGRFSRERLSERKKALNTTPRTNQKYCAECQECLQCGYYSQHNGQLFCNVPCYPSLFSTLVERKENLPDDCALDDENILLRKKLLPKLRTYNTYYINRPCQISCREEGTKLIVEGVLKIYWGLVKPVTLQESDISYWKDFRPRSGSKVGFNQEDAQTEKELRKTHKIQPSVRRSKSGVSSRYMPKKKVNGGYDVIRNNGHQNCKDAVDPSSFNSPFVKKRIGCSVCNSNNSSRDGSPSDENISFIPPYGSSTTLRLTNATTTPQVVKMLLNKFMVRDLPGKFSLFTVYEGGGLRRLQNENFPLLTRLNLGPCEDVAKIFIMEVDEQSDISLEVAQYINFAQPVLETFVQKFKEEEEREVEKVKDKYGEYKKLLISRIKEMEARSIET